MSILAKLKSIGIHFPKLKDITGIKFSNLININIDRSFHVEGSTVIIDPKRLNGKQRRGLAQIIKIEALNEGGAIVDESNSTTVNQVLEVLPSFDAVSKKFSDIIPPGDVPLLDACLFLRKRFDAGAPVEDLKGQIVRAYGPRGRNFSNLCTAGYLETVFWPLYEELLTSNPDNMPLVRAKFLTFYNTILNELPWTEFVSVGSSVAKTTVHIVEKMERNLQSGVRYMNIHGLGATNVKKINLILPEVQKQTGAMAVKVEQDLTRIFVRLEIPPKQLGSSHPNS